MIGSKLLRFLPLVVVLGVTAAETDGFRIVKPEDIQWTASKELPGLSGVVLAGDPSKPGPYVIRGRFAPGVINPPHTHDKDRFIVVISGTWYAGIGDTIEPDKMQPLPAGSLMVHPAGGAHYDGSKDGEVIVQISGVGPVSTDYLK